MVEGDQETRQTPKSIVHLVASSSCLSPTMQEQELDMSDDRLDNFITGTDYQPLDVIGEGAYGIVWCVLTFLYHSFIR